MSDSPFPPPSAAPAGWYPDAADPRRLRYFNGSHWTSERSLGPEPTWPPALPMSAALGALVVLGASLVAFHSLLERLVDTGWNVGVLLALVSLLVYGPAVLWMLYVSRRWGDGQLLHRLGVRPRWSDLGWGALTALVALVVAAVTVAVVRGLDVPFRGNLEIDLSLLAVDSRRTILWSYGLALVLVAPVVEELLFRGVVYAGFVGRLPVAVAIGAQGVLFGCAHFSPRFGREAIGLLIVLSAIGVVLGVAAWHFRRVAPVIVAHAIYNGLGFLAAIHAT